MRVAGKAIGLAISCLLVVGWLSRERRDNSILEQKDSLTNTFYKLRSDPDVRPIKGEGKALAAVQHLGGLPDLSLQPKKKQDSVSAVAAQAGIKLKAAPATQDEKARARAAVEALMKSAEGKIKVQHTHRSKKASFHAKMAKAMFNYKLYKGEITGGVHDAKPISPLDAVVSSNSQHSAESSKSIFHSKMEQALLNYRAYKNKGVEDVMKTKPVFTVPSDMLSKGSVVLRLRRTTENVGKGGAILRLQVLKQGGAASEVKQHKDRYICSQTGCRPVSHRASGFSDAVPAVALSPKELAKQMRASGM